MEEEEVVVSLTEEELEKYMIIQVLLLDEVIEIIHQGQILQKVEEEQQQDHNN